MKYGGREGGYHWPQAFMAIPELAAAVNAWIRSTVWIRRGGAVGEEFFLTVESSHDTEQSITQN